jgi:hypothetical protein
MALDHSDFRLTDEQLEEINHHIAEQGSLYAKAKEDPPSGVSVKFEWTPGLGRSVTVHFDGSVDDYTVESCNLV